jgi:hypothetical protein
MRANNVDQGVVVKCSVQHKRVDLIMMQACGAAMSIVLYFGAAISSQSVLLA